MEENILGGPRLHPQQWDSKVAQQVKVFATKPNEQSVVSRTHMMKGENY